MKRLPDSELELMMIIWESREAVTRTQIVARCSKTKSEKLVLGRVDKEGKITGTARCIGDCIYACMGNGIKIVSLETGELLEKIKINVNESLAAFAKDDKENVYFACEEAKCER